MPPLLSTAALGLTPAPITPPALRFARACVLPCCLPRLVDHRRSGLRCRLDVRQRRPLLTRLFTPVLHHLFGRSHRADLRRRLDAPFAFGFLPRRLPLFLHYRYAGLRKRRGQRVSWHFIALVLRVLRAWRLAAALRCRLRLHRCSWRRSVMNLPAHRGVVRLVTVMPVAQFVLVFAVRITLAGIVPLIHRRRCRPRQGAVIPVVPVVTVLVGNVIV